MRHWTFWTILSLLVMFLIGVAFATSDESGSDRAGRGSATSKTAGTRSATSAASRPSHDVMILNELVDLYEPVPFAHKAHADMADMWDGCTTCHHHTPTATTQRAAPATSPAKSTAARHASKDNAAKMPACKSCHLIAAKEVDIRMPSLKGAYHRQCLNCHRDWMDQNACNICHAPRKNPASAPSTATAPAPDDIVGRMHKPLAEPSAKRFTARFTPVAGPLVVFRHDEHTKTFGIKCVTCHRHDACASCHANGATRPALNTIAAESKPHEPPSPPRPVRPGRTWRAAHEPCVNCHQDDKCTHCHYQENRGAPPAFDHRSAAQLLDKDHSSLACGACHDKTWSKGTVSCGESKCHKAGILTYPAKKPGPVRVTTHSVPTATQATQPARLPSTLPSSRPAIIRIRRGGL